MPAARRPSEAAAALAAAALIVQLLAAQATLALAACLLLAGKLTRWRPAWLSVPACAGLAWALAIGPARAGAGYAAAVVHLAHQMTGQGGIGRLLTRPGALLGGWTSWLPAQLPLALLAAPAEAALLSLPDWRAGEFRPGLVASVRTAYVSWTLRRGEMASADGATLGVRPATGSRLGVSWAQARHGVLLTGQDAAALAETGYALAAAAIQARKTVIVIDLTGDSWLATAITDAARAAAAPVRLFGSASGCYDPVAGSDPARSAALALSMIDWRGGGARQRKFGAEYLTAAAACAAAWAAADDAAPDGAARDGRPGLSLGALASALRPATLRGLLDEMPGHLRGQSALRDRAARLCGQAEADPGLLAALSGQFSQLRASALGQYLMPACHQAPAAGHGGRREASQPPAASEISLQGALRRREVIMFSLDRRAHRPAAAMIARLAAADLAAVLGDRAAARAPADCLAWINGFPALEPRQLTSLIALGPEAGAAVLASTQLTAAAAALAPPAGVLAVRGPAPPELRDMTGTPGAATAAAEHLSIVSRRPVGRVEHGRAVPPGGGLPRRDAPAAGRAGPARQARPRAAR